MPPFAENFLKINSKPWKSITPQKFGILWVKIKTNESHSNQFLQIQYLQTVLCFQISAFKFHPLAHCPKNNLTLSIHSWSRWNGRCLVTSAYSYMHRAICSSSDRFRFPANIQIIFGTAVYHYDWLIVYSTVQCTVYTVHCTVNT